MKSYFFDSLTKCFKQGNILQKSGGRNFLGRVCVVGLGGGHKRLKFKIDFFRRINCMGTILKHIYDGNRSAFLALVLYDNGLCSLIVLAENIALTSQIYSGIYYQSNLTIGSATLIKHFKLFSVISCVESFPFKGFKLCRAAGTSCLLIGKTNEQAILKLSSGWQLKVSFNCQAMLGVVAYKDYKRKIYFNAGHKRNFGLKPKVRGVAKNPCDHPHGGGNGKKSPLNIPVNFKGQNKK